MKIFCKFYTHILLQTLLWWIKFTPIQFISNLGQARKSNVKTLNDLISYLEFVPIVVTKLGSPVYSLHIG